ncbi:MAG: DUF3467 domain-containing protein [Caldilineales bacterium]|nr:DUF3467 domain-containing protein [Caldilineales bacterium]
MADAKPGKQLQIEVPVDIQPNYANFAIINQNYNEIFIDFAHVTPAVPKTRVHTRIVLTPYHAKLLLQALSTNLANYEKRFGEIKTQGAGLPEPPLTGFDSGQVH